MFDIGWSELLVIGVVALVVIGPKDLPDAFRNVGRWVAKARTLAREFQTHVDDLMREADVSDVKREFAEMTQVPELDELDSDLMHGEPLKPKSTTPEAAAKAASAAESSVTTPPAP